MTTNRNKKRQDRQANLKRTAIGFTVIWLIALAFATLTLVQEERRRDTEVHNLKVVNRVLRKRLAEEAEKNKACYQPAPLPVPAADGVTLGQ